MSAHAMSHVPIFITTLWTFFQGNFLDLDEDSHSSSVEVFYPPTSQRRKRIKYTRNQQLELEAAYATNQYPSASERDQLAAKLGIGESRIQVHLLLYKAVVHKTGISRRQPGLANFSAQESRVQSPPYPLAGIVLGSPEFIFAATLVNNQLVCLWQIGFLNKFLFTNVCFCRCLLAKTKTTMSWFTSNCPRPIKSFFDWKKKTKKKKNETFRLMG